MNLSKRISAFSVLGEIIRDALSGKPGKYSAALNHLIETQHTKNPWFTPDNIRMALSAVADELTPENLNKWCSFYPGLAADHKPVRAGVIMAGNIPLAGFHDMLSVLITGNRLIAKTSSKDNDLPALIIEIMKDIDDGFSDMITLSDGVISGFDIVIATGSDNSSRYFEYYFGKYPHLIRKNRNSIALIDGCETVEELTSLGTDIFSYFGLGCRSVSKIFVPEGYDLKHMISCWNRFEGIINHTRYANNYEYHKAVLLVNNDKFMDTGFLLIRYHSGLSSPVAVLYYETYKNRGTFKIIAENMKDKIQCIVGRDYTPFGRAQMPALWDYADGTDTIEFLLKKISPGIL